MSWNPNSSLAPVSRLWGALAFRLTAGYALAGVLLVFFATASLYLVLVNELEKSTDLFLADKVQRATHHAAGETRRPGRTAGGN